MSNTTLPSSTDDLWRHIEAITNGYVNVRNDFGRGYTATLNGHHGDRHGETPHEALALLIDQINLPATSDEWEIDCQRRAAEWNRRWEQHRAEHGPVVRPYPDVPSEYEIGLNRGRLGDWLQEVIDAGWNVRLDEVFGATIASHDGTAEYFVICGEGVPVEISFVRAYLAWRARESEAA